MGKYFPLTKTKNHPAVKVCSKSCAAVHIVSRHVGDAEKVDAVVAPVSVVHILRFT